VHRRTRGPRTGSAEQPTPVTIRSPAAAVTSFTAFQAALCTPNGASNRSHSDAPFQSAADVPVTCGRQVSGCSQHHAVVEQSVEHDGGCPARTARDWSAIPKDLKAVARHKFTEYATQDLYGLEVCRPRTASMASSATSAGQAASCASTIATAGVGGGRHSPLLQTSCCSALNDARFMLAFACIISTSRTTTFAICSKDNSKVLKSVGLGVVPVASSPPPAPPCCHLQSGEYKIQCFHDLAYPHWPSPAPSPPPAPPHSPSAANGGRMRRHAGRLGVI